MKILALEFSSARRSVAVLNGADGKPFEAVDTSPGREMRPFELIEFALRAAGLEREQIGCVAVGIGPGSYAGIRVAISLAQGWQLATGVKLLGISSVEAIACYAAAELNHEKFGVLVDAQRGEFYLAGYETRDGAAREISPLRIASRDEVHRLEAAGEQMVGPEVTQWYATGNNVFPTASHIAELAARQNDFVPGEKLEPIYLRETTFVKSPPSREIRL